MALLPTFQDSFTYMYNEFKQAITISTITRVRNEEGDTTETLTSTSTYGIVTELRDAYSEQKFGLPESGETVIFVKPSETVNLVDTITVGSTNYRIINIIDRTCSGTVVYKEIRVSIK